jgi:hypothetical protein
MLTPVGGGPYPYVFAQSLPSIGVKPGLRRAASSFLMQSLPDKDVDSACGGTFFSMLPHSSG